MKERILGEVLSSINVTVRKKRESLKKEITSVLDDKIVKESNIQTKEKISKRSHYLNLFVKGRVNQYAQSPARISRFNSRSKLPRAASLKSGEKKLSKYISTMQEYFNKDGATEKKQDILDAKIEKARLPKEALMGYWEHSKSRIEKLSNSYDRQKVRDDTLVSFINRSSSLCSSLIDKSSNRGSSILNEGLHKKARMATLQNCMPILKKMESPSTINRRVSRPKITLLKLI